MKKVRRLQVLRRAAPPQVADLAKKLDLAESSVWDVIATRTLPIPDQAHLLRLMETLRSARHDIERVVAEHKERKP